MTASLSLDTIAARVYDDANINTTLHVENIGGGVMALVDFGGLTVTLDGGQREVDTDDRPADVLVCFDGAAVATCTASTLDDVVAAISIAANAAY